MHICIYIKGHLVKRKGCINRRNDFVKQGRVVIKSYENCFKRGRVGSRKEESYQNSGV